MLGKFECLSTHKSGENKMEKMSMTNGDLLDNRMNHLKTSQLQNNIRSSIAWFSMCTLNPKHTECNIISFILIWNFIYFCLERFIKVLKIDWNVWIHEFLFPAVIIHEIYAAIKFIISKLNQSPTTPVIFTDYDAYRKEIKIISRFKEKWELKTMLIS